MDRIAVKDWLIKSFAVCKIYQPPIHLVEHYADCICSSRLSFQEVQQELLYLTSANNQQQVSQQPTSPPVNKVEERSPSTTNSGSGIPAPNLSDEQKIRDYIDALYIHYTGRKGHPSDTQFLTTNLHSRSYTLNQAELHVKFSKQAKNYQKSKQLEKAQKMREYIKELYRVFLKSTPTEEEVQGYVQEINEGRSLQDVEDEFKLYALQAPK